MDKIEKCWHSINLMLLGGGRKASYIRSHHLFGQMGRNCSFQSWRLPIYPKLVHIHDNVIIATDVRFVVHDAISFMLNRKYNDYVFAEQVGCIEIMNNVFIGSGTRVLYNVRIGNNVIIGAGSLVNKDVPDNSVYAGVPARFICTFDEYVKKAREYTEAFKGVFGQTSIREWNENLIQKIYDEFCRNKEKINDS